MGASESLLREEIEGKRRLYPGAGCMRSHADGAKSRPVDRGHLAVRLRHPEAHASDSRP